MACAWHVHGMYRWVDEEHVRVQSEADSKVSAALEAIRTDTGASIAELKGQIAEAIVPLGEPGALTTLQQALVRVETLGEAVAQLCAYMQSLKIKEVAMAAENRVTELEDRLAVGALPGMGGAMLEKLEARLATLEGALQQEQQSSLKALQAILEASGAAGGGGPSVSE